MCDTSDTPYHVTEGDGYVTCKRYCWKDADYKGMSDYLSNYDWNYLFSKNLTVEKMWSAFSEVILDVIDTHVPAITTPKSYQGKKTLPKDNT